MPRHLPNREPQQEINQAFLDKTLEKELLCEQTQLFLRKPVTDAFGRPVNRPIRSELINWKKNIPLVERINQRALMREGVGYLSITDAAEIAQVSPHSFRSWIRQEKKFNGFPLRSFFLEGINRNVVTVEAAFRAADRFSKVPFDEHAEGIVIGKTTDGSGYLTMKEAAAKLGIARVTMNVWASDHKASPLDRLLDVIRCNVSGQLYISEREIEELARHVPKNGLSRGPRPQQQLILK